MLGKALSHVVKTSKNIDETYRWNVRRLDREQQHAMNQIQREKDTISREQFDQRAMSILSRQSDIPEPSIASEKRGVTNEKCKKKKFTSTPTLSDKANDHFEVERRSVVRNQRTKKLKDEKDARVGIGPKEEHFNQLAMSASVRKRMQQTKAHDSMIKITDSQLMRQIEQKPIYTPERRISRTSESRSTPNEATDPCQPTQFKSGRRYRNDSRPHALFGDHRIEQSSPSNSIKQGRCTPKETSKSNKEEQTSMEKRDDLGRMSLAFLRCRYLRLSPKMTKELRDNCAEAGVSMSDLAVDNNTNVSEMVAAPSAKRSDIFDATSTKDGAGPQK